MLLSQIIGINEKGIVASSVNFEMMNDPEMNRNLCEGFIFNYDSKKPELSTVGILDALRRSYHSRNEPNIHLMIQQYGKGKSHFAVAIANFFKKNYESPEVQGILQGVEIATGSGAKAIAEGLRFYKQNQHHQHLVVCLSGDRGGDIRKHFLQALLKSLEEEGIEDSLAQHTCSEPLRYLESLDAGSRAIAEQYLESLGNPDGDLNCLIQLLRENNPAVIPTVKKLALHITRFIPDFSADIDIEAILKDLLDNFCYGENPRFQGILILFDELNYYLQSWAVDLIGAGGTALQNITNICENNKGKIALLSFTQIHPSKAVGISATAKDSYFKLSSRLAPKDSTYEEPSSSLELVLENLLIHKEDSSHWKEFRYRWDNTLLSEARIAYEQRIKSYSQKGWSFDKFYRYLSLGCFPLHPMTAYLLCNLDFIQIQNRTAIQFVKSYVKEFIQTQPVEQVGQLNYIYSIALVDTFVENFSTSSIYTGYKEAYNTVFGSESPDELAVLKALFLFYVSGEKLAKTDREEHEEILTNLAGLSKSRVKTALNKLVQTRGLIYYRPETKLYRFFEGINPKGIEEEVEEKTKGASTSVNDVVVYCQSRIKQYLDNDTIIATQFVKENKLVGEDWQFKYKVYSIDGFIKALASDYTLRGVTEKGILAYVLAETQEELQEFRRTVDEYLSSSPIRSQIAVAIPSEETGDLARVILKIKTLQNKEPTEKRLLGAAYEQLLQRWEEQVNKQIEDLLKFCTYYCTALAKIPPAERVKPQRVISALLQDLYPFVPPVDESDKMRSGHTTGSKIIGFVAKQLFTDSLNPNNLPPEQAYSTVIDKVFVSQWGLLKKTSQKYIVQKPTHENIRAAWDRISQLTDLEEMPEKTLELEKIWQALSAPPYGYSEYTFTTLLVGWLAYHRKEVFLRGSFTVSAKKGASIAVKTQSLKDWSNTDILQKPSLFVSDWIVKGKGTLVRHKKLNPPVLPSSPINYELAQQYLSDVTTFLESNEPDTVEVGEVIKNRDKVAAGVEQISNWFKPVEEAEAMSGATTIEALLLLYPQLLQHPPAFELRLDAIAVNPTQQQRDRQTQALQGVGEQIEQLIFDKSEGCESLSTEKDVDAYKVEIEQILHHIKQVSNLPPHLSDILRNATQTAHRKLGIIQEQTQIREHLLEIQHLYKNLNDSSTQQDYTHTRTEIAPLQASIPNDVEAAVEVQRILEDIEQEYRNLTQQIEMWEERFFGVTSPNQILELIKEIHSQRHRFTEDASKQKVHALQEQLEKELLKIKSRDDAEKLVRAELSAAQQKLQRIRDLPLNKLSEAFQVYQELISSSLPSTGHSVTLGEYQEKLDGFKTQGHTVISEKFAQLYNRKLNRLEEYDNRKELLHKSKNILAEAINFVDVRTNIEQALQNLDFQRQALHKELEEKQKQDRDRQIMQTIHQIDSTQIDTLHLCEETIKKVQNFQVSLNYPNIFTNEIEQKLHLLQGKQASYCQKIKILEDRLKTVDNSKDLGKLRDEYTKLDLLFKGSNEYPNYQQVQENIHLLKEDIEQIERLENSYQQCNAIASCDDGLAIIDNQEVSLHDLERFKQRILYLQENLRIKKQSYIEQLSEIQNKLGNLKNLKEAQRLQKELSQKSVYYRKSQEEKRYETVNAEVNSIVNLLQISETQKVDTVDACQVEIDRLIKWRQNNEEITSTVQTLLDKILARLEQTQQQIQEQQKTAAIAWLEDLEKQYIRLGQSSTNSFETANKLIKQIEKQKNQYKGMLEKEHIKILEGIIERCLQIQNQDRESKIISLFQELPHQQRESLLQRLSEYLTVITEDS